MFRKIVSFIISFTMIFNNILLADGYYDVNNTLPDEPNAECYFVFDRLASPECNNLYEKYNGKISDMLNESDTFYKCLISNCGLYQTDSAHYEQSYQYNMEIVKKCVLAKDDTLNYNELKSSDWFVALNSNLTDEVNVSTSDTKTRFIPFKVLKYRCPKYVKIEYGEKERVLQYPVLCFNTDNTNINNLIKSCLEDKNNDSCKELSNTIGGNLKSYIKYIYCDTDTDGDGFPDALSPALQRACNRADAAELRCTKNSLCTTTVKCVEQGNKETETYEYKTCDALKRSYKDYVVNTQCGDTVDIYQANPNCIRINSVTNAREAGIEYVTGNDSTTNLNTPIRYIEVKNYPNSNDYMNSYHEYVLYQKKDNSQLERFVALIYPKALYKKKSSYTLLGKILNFISGGLVAVFEGDASFIGPGAIGAGFVTKSSSIPNTVVDNLLRKAIDDKYPISTNKDVKGITYKVKVKRSLLKKKYKMYFMKAWWDASIVDETNLAGDPKSEDWIWSGINRRDIHYYFKFRVNPDEILVGYTINANGNYFSTPEVYYKQYSNVQCSDTVSNVNVEWKKVASASRYPIKSPSIQNMILFIPYPSLYLFKFYNGNEFVGSKYINLGYNLGQYPMINVSTLMNGSSDLGAVLTSLYENKYKALIINDTVNDYMNLSETKTLIDNLTTSLLKVIENRNIDEIYKRAKPFTEYTDIKDFYDFYVLNYALDYYINNSQNSDNLCYENLNGNIEISDDSDGVDITDENTYDNFNDDLLTYKECLINNIGSEINSTLNNDKDIISLDYERLQKLIEYTNNVYNDFINTVPNNINNYLNKSGNRYTLTNDIGSWSMSFKSLCGDYEEAKNNALSHYMDNIKTITSSYFISNVTSISNSIINLIDFHMKNITLNYKYNIYECTESKVYYETNDNNGSLYKLLTINSKDKHFYSYGGYICDSISLSPTGDTSMKNCRITNSQKWTSIAKKLDVSTAEMEELEHQWLRDNGYQDNKFISNTLWDADVNGFNNLRVNLSTTKDNGIYKEADKYIEPLIREYVTNLVKNFYIKKVTYQLDNSIPGDSILESYINEYYQKMLDEGLNTVNAGNFKPFNKIEIFDMLSDPDSKYAINYTITTPGNLLIQNPNSLNFVMLSFPEVRKYRCYGDFETCQYKDEQGCSLDNILDYNYVNDFTGKRVATLRKETYKCKKTTTINTCLKFDIQKQCYNTEVANPYIEFDDNDFSEYFGKAVGENLALNEALHIFSGQEYRCEDGLFTDFSWLTGPAFLAQVANVIGGYIMEKTGASEALLKWIKGESTAQDVCANAWLSCMAKNGSTASIAIQKGTSAVLDCDNEVKNIYGCASFSGVGPLSQTLNSIMNNSFVQTLQDPLTSLAIQVAYNLAFNTFDNCNQCTNKECAESHKPQEAAVLYKMTYGKNRAITGAEYGLGPNFVAYNQCFYKDDDCAMKFFGKCLRKKENYCCYNTKIARILAGQIYEQLGLTYQENGCNAIKITDLPKIDFTPCPAGVIPSPANKCINYKELEDYINSKINWNLKGSFDMNKLIQAVMDEGAN